MTIAVFVSALSVALGVITIAACALAILLPCLVWLGFMAWLLSGGMYE